MKILIRFDDIAENMNWYLMEKCEKLFDELKIKPVMGVIPDNKDACPFTYGAYIATIELLKNLAPFYSFLEHDVPRQRLFQAALAAYGREDD